MKIDDRTLNQLIVESEDLQADALRDMKASIDDLTEIRHEREGRVDVDEVQRYNAVQRDVVRDTFTSAGPAAKGLLAGAFGAALLGIVAAPAFADTAVDIQILNTASSLENLAVATCGAALGLGFIKDGNAVVKKFAETTMSQHAEHGKAFNAQAAALGGKEQTATNAKYTPVVEQAKPTLQSPADVVKLAATLEEVATDTYLKNLTLLSDNTTKKVMASVMGVESQHLATLLAVQALLAGGAAEVTQPDAKLKPLVDQQFAQVKDVTGAAKLALMLEDIASATYLKALPGLQSKDAILLAGQGFVINMQHAAILHYALGEYPVPETFAKTDKAAF